MSDTHTKQAWQVALTDLITDPKELLSLLQLHDPALLNAAEAAARLFPLRVPRRFALRMQKANMHDPLLLQVLPLHAELIETQGYNHDPLNEAATNPIPGLLHKYQSRALVTLTSACAVHCRYCFRRHFPYEKNNPGRTGWEKLFAYLEENPAINEVILSGGDPLSVSDKLLTAFTKELARIPHITRLRIHTRLPIVLPERITEDFLAWIKSLSLSCIIVLHANHPFEIDEEVKCGLQALREAGVHLLNQSVLLKDVNDRVETLVALSETLFAAGVLPYYLHVLDKVQGAAHFDLDHEIAKTLWEGMRSQLPGFLVPRLAAEIAGEPAKKILL